jgi:uncharacterized protein YukE
MGWTDLDPGAGDPYGLSRVAADFEDAADRAATARFRLGSLAAATGGRDWKGEAARAFQTRIGHLPDHLSAMAASYTAAADGMRDYARDVRRISADADDLKARLNLAETEHADAVAHQATFDEPLNLPVGVFDPAQASARQAADDAVEAAAHRLRSLRDDLAELAFQRGRADQAACDALDRAHELGMRNASAWSHAWHRVSTDVSHWSENVWQAGAAVNNDIKGVVRYYVDHPEALTRLDHDLETTLAGLLTIGASDTIGGALSATGVGAVVGAPVIVGGTAVGAGIMLTGAAETGRDLGQAFDEATADENEPAPEDLHPDVNTKISRQKQENGHLPTKKNPTPEGGYFENLDDAQAVLDAYHSGAARVIEIKEPSGDILVEYDEVTGFNNNQGAKYLNQPTHRFIIKGTRSVKIVPTTPKV